MALSDTPYTQAPQSQKRLQKSTERSTAWLAHLLQHPNAESSDVLTGRPSVLVNLVGGSDKRARMAFAESLVEVLHGKEQESISPLRTLDEGVVGYQVEIPPLRSVLKAERTEDLSRSAQDAFNESEELFSLMRASLEPLPATKLRISYGATFPHEILGLISDVGVDLFDSHWAQKAADIGIALDFIFPAPGSGTSQRYFCPPPKSRSSSVVDIGHNLFNFDYANDHSRLASSFLDNDSNVGRPSDPEVKPPPCACGACSPKPPSTTLLYDQVTQQPDRSIPSLPPYTRSYIHHLLHTHEMSSHTLLAIHNLSVLDAFFSGIREVIDKSKADPDVFTREVQRFSATYADPRELFSEAQRDWARVEYERGKGRLARERQREGESKDQGAVDLQ